MVKFITLDSSVIVCSLRKEEEKYEDCLKLVKAVGDGKYIAIEPYLVLVEVVAAIRRRTDSEELAEKVKNALLSGMFNFFDLIHERALESCEISKNTGLKGMDSIVVQISKEFNSTLVTLDKEIKEKGSKIVEIKMPSELV